MENRSDLPYGDQPTITIVNQFLAPNPKVWSVISAHIFEYLPSDQGWPGASWSWQNKHRRRPGCLLAQASEIPGQGWSWTASSEKPSSSLSQWFSSRSVDDNNLSTSNSIPSLIQLVFGKLPVWKTISLCCTLSGDKLVQCTQTVLLLIAFRFLWL